MEFSFINTRLTFRSIVIYSEGREWSFVSQPRVSLVPKTVQDTECVHKGKILSMLETHLARRDSSSKKWGLDGGVASLGTVGLLASHDPTTKELVFAISYSIEGDADHHICRLVNVLGEENVKFKFELKVFGAGSECRSISEEDFILVTSTSIQTNRKEKLFMFAKNASRLVCENEWIESEQGYEIHLISTMKISDQAVNSIITDSLQGPPMDTLKKILGDSFTMDGLIKVEGAEVKCHRCILNAWSPVFKAMFETNMKEGVTSTIEIEDMTEQGIRALLSYLYCQEVTEISKSCSIAFELLVAGDKYDIPSLRKSVIDLLFLKDIKWFTPSVIMQLLQFARNKKSEAGEDETYKNLEKLAMTALKKEPREKMVDCLEFKKMFLEPNLGMQFSLYLFHYF